MEPTTPDSSLPADRTTPLVLLSLLATSFMLYQVAVLRELRFQLSTVYALTPFLFSSVLVFIGLGSLVAERFQERPRKVLGACLLLLPVLALLLFAVTVALPQKLMDHSGEAFAYGDVDASAQKAPESYLPSIFVVFVLVAIAGYGPVFFVQGLAFALLFHDGRKRGVLGNVYGADLIASGWGALLGGVLTFFLTPSDLGILASLLLLLAAWLGIRYLALPRPIVALVSVALSAIVVAAVAVKLPARLEEPRWMEGRLVESLWSRYRRIDVTSLEHGIVRVYTDGLVFQGYGPGDGNRRDPRMLPLELIGKEADHVGSVLVMGAGTGADVRLLRLFGPKELAITAVEIDGGFVDAAAQIPWLWRQYESADIVVQEGRYFLEKTAKAFDMVIYAYIDPQSAISSVGLPDANFLYTSRGLGRAYARVNPGGYLVITRVFLVDDEERFVSSLCATLAAAGIPRSEIALYREPGAIAWGYYGQLSTFQAVVKKGGVPPGVESPYRAPVPFREGGRVTTDAYPMSMGTRVWLERVARAVTGSLGAEIALGLVLGALLLRVATSVAHLNFFLLGLGSFLVESLVLYNSFLLLGDPNLSACVAVGMLLLFGGVGSLLSPRLQKLRAHLFATPAIVLLYALTAPSLNTLTITFPIGIRTLIFSAHLAIPALVVGSMFPIALRAFPAERVSRMFFIDLVGCALGPVAFWLALAFVGISMVWAGSVASYVVVGIILARAARP
ncbi:MAG: hypothetical protein U0166_05525 [Acidobacteriota bacterium]